MNQAKNKWMKLSKYAFKLYLQQLPFPKTILGLDLGLKSSGMAITSSDMKHAFVCRD